MEWDALKTGDYARFTPAEQAALDFADHLTRGTRAMISGDFQTLSPFFTNEQVVDLDLLVELFNMTTRSTGPSQESA